MTPAGACRKESEALSVIGWGWCTARMRGVLRRENIGRTQTCNTRVPDANSMRAGTRMHVSRRSHVRMAFAQLVVARAEGVR